MKTWIMALVAVAMVTACALSGCSDSQTKVVDETVFTDDNAIVRKYKLIVPQEFNGKYYTGQRDNIDSLQWYSVSVYKHKVYVGYAMIHQSQFPALSCILGKYLSHHGISEMNMALPVEKTSGVYSLKADDRQIYIDELTGKSMSLRVMKKDDSDSAPYIADLNYKSEQSNVPIGDARMLTVKDRCELCEKVKTWFVDHYDGIYAPEHSDMFEFMPVTTASLEAEIARYLTLK